MIARISFVFVFSVLLVLFLLPSAVSAQEANRIQIHTDFSEADVVLAILDKRHAAQQVSASDWRTLVATEPYQRLKRREAAMHHEFTDDDFRKFVLSEKLLREREALERAVHDWKRADLRAAATRMLQYLPPESEIRTKVFPLIKPLENDFVFDMDTDPAIFLYIDPSESAASFEHDVAHEMHHIGLSSVDKQYEQKIASLPHTAKRTAELMGLFGEGEAMLAAAGGPDVDPVATESQEIKDYWVRGKRDFNSDLTKVSDFFLQVLNGKLQDEAIGEKASEFFGLQGPWYTVGYKMAVMVERRYGRAALIECMSDPRLLLARYNAAAEEINMRPVMQTSMDQEAQPLALWPHEILEKTQALKK